MCRQHATSCVRSRRCIVARAWLASLSAIDMSALPVARTSAAHWLAHLFSVWSVRRCWQSWRKTRSARRLRRKPRRPRRNGGRTQRRRAPQVCLPFPCLACAYRRHKQRLLARVADERKGVVLESRTSCTAKDVCSGCSAHMDAALNDRAGGRSLVSSH